LGNASIKMNVAKSIFQLMLVRTVVTIVHNGGYHTLQMHD